MVNNTTWNRFGNRLSWTGAFRALVLFAGFGLTGCFGLSRGETPQEHYVLGSGGPQPAEARGSETEGLTLGVRRIQLDAYLQTPLIVVRRGAHQVRFSESHRWGEPLEGGINRAVAGYLAQRTSVRNVEVAPWSPGLRFDYLVQLHVSRFEGVVTDNESGASAAGAVGSAGSAGEAHVRASWEIVRQRDGSIVSRGTMDYRDPGWTVGNYVSLVTLLDRGLDQLSQDIVAGLEALPAAASEARIPDITYAERSAARSTK